MKTISFEETKQVELSILIDFANFCDRHKLTYFLADGTLLGAVRHNGFIPWDDDVDVWMPRADYDKFLKIYNEENVGRKYKVVNPYDSISRHAFAKMIDLDTIKIESGVDYSNGNLGIDIDIFPLDGQPEKNEDFVKWYNKLHNIYKFFLCFILDKKGSLKRELTFPLVRFAMRNKNNLLSKAKKLHEKYPYKDCSFVGTIESYFDLTNNRYPKEWFSEYVNIDFEGHQFKIPVCYDKILTQAYGDYMQLPPEEKRISHHTNKNYWLDKE